MDQVIIGIITLLLLLVVLYYGGFFKDCKEAWLEDRKLFITKIFCVIGGFLVLIAFGCVFALIAIA